MSNEKDFVIEDGVLEKYVGPGGDVVISEGVTRIGSFSCWENTNIISVTIPNGVTEIGNTSFRGCHSLKKVTIPTTVRKIGEAAFADCVSLQELVISTDIEEIEAFAFNGCKGLANQEGFVIVNHTLFGYYGDGGDISVPEGVKEIQEYAFVNARWGENSNIFSIKLPNSIVMIKDHAFDGCLNLKNIQMPTRIQQVGRNSFSGCPHLCNEENGCFVSNQVLYKCNQGENVVVPEGITEIARSAFDYSVETIRIPESVCEFEKDTFGGLSDLVNIVASEEMFGKIWSKLTSGQKNRICQNDIAHQQTPKAAQNEYYLKSRKWIQILLSTNNSTMITAVLGGKTILPIAWVDELLSAQGSVLSAETKAILMAYKNKHYPPEVVENMESSKSDLLLGLRQRTDAEWKEVLALKATNGGWTITSWQGDDTDIVLPSMIDGKPVLAIGNSAFSPRQKRAAAYAQARKNIRSVTIPESVTSLGDAAWELWETTNAPFYGCDSLQEVILPRTFKKLDDFALCGCNNLKQIFIPANVVKIGDGAIPSSVSCISVDPNNKKYIVEDNCLIDVKKKQLVAAFGESITPKEDLFVTIRWDAVSCDHVKYITLPIECSTIPASCFAECAKLESVTLSPNTTKIPDSAFADCISLVSFSVPPMTVQIGTEAFVGCTALKDIYIPENVSKIAKNAFLTQKGKLLKALTIHAPAGSYAEQYAKEHNIPFVAE